MNFTRASITLSAVLYTLAVPVLEINDTHVFNPDWTPHVRIHEVWQLFTNSAIGLLCLWLTWKKGEYLLSIILSMLVMGGFLLAFIVRDLYGGSMKYLDGSEKTLLGINIGVLGFGLAFTLLVVSLLLNLKMNKNRL